MAGVELTVIINSFNRLPLLKGCLTSLCDVLINSGFSYSIVIFDARSTDGSPEWIRTFINERGKEDIVLIGPGKEEQDSFSFGVNAAASYAMNKYPDLKYLFLYETDNVITSVDALIHAHRLLEENRELAACGFTVKKHNGTHAGFGSSFPGISSFILGQQLSFVFKLNDPLLEWKTNSYSSFSYADVVYTSPLLIKNEDWGKLKGFDSALFPFSDCDVDLAFRIRKMGKKMVVLKTSAVIHDNQEMTSEWSAKRTTNFYRARLSYFKKHNGAWIHLLKPLLVITHLAELFVLFFLLVAGKRKINSLKTRWFLIRNVFNNYK